jgi:hypothetical protein
MAVTTLPVLPLSYYLDGREKIKLTSQQLTLKHLGEEEKEKKNMAHVRFAPKLFVVFHVMMCPQCVLLGVTSTDVMTAYGGDVLPVCTNGPFYE